jgi:hypothetical protein
MLSLLSIIGIILCALVIILALLFVLLIKVFNLLIGKSVWFILRIVFGSLFLIGLIMIGIGIIL